MRILIVEDEEKLASLIKKGLEKLGYAADYVTDGETAERRIEIHHQDYDLIILDLMLPKKHGSEVCKIVREQNITTPIIILTARSATEDKILALDSGADDYLVKPFSFKELAARVRALLRRPRESLPCILKSDDITVDTTTRRVFRNNTEIPLTLKEFELLEYLLRNPNQVLNREEIFAHLWDFNSNSFSNVIDVHVKNLRRKLGYDEHKNKIETVRGVGYRFNG